MSDLILHGSRRWNAVPGVVGFEEQYDSAVEVICSYAGDAIRLNRQNPQVGPSIYLASSPFSLLGDLHGAVCLVRETPEFYHRVTLDRILQMMPTEWRTVEGFSLFLELVWEETLDEQLSRVWRSPGHFTRSTAFDAELGRRVMAYSLPATVWAGPLTAQVIESALAQLLRDHENSKWEVEFGMRLAHQLATAEGRHLDRKEIKQIKRDFDKNPWPDEWVAVYETHSKALSRRLSHVMRLCEFMNWNSIDVPQLSPNRSAKSQV